MAKFLQITLERLPMLFNVTKPMKEIQVQVENAENKVYKEHENQNNFCADSGFESGTDRAGNEISIPQPGIENVIKNETVEYDQITESEVVDQSTEYPVTYFGDTRTETSSPIPLPEIDTTLNTEQDEKPIPQPAEIMKILAKPTLYELKLNNKSEETESGKVDKCQAEIQDINSNGISSSQCNVYCDKNNLVNDTRDKDEVVTVSEGAKCDIVSDNVWNGTKVSSKRENGALSRGGKRRRPKFSHHISNEVTTKKIDNSVSDSDICMPYKSYRLAYIPGRQNVIKVIRRRALGDSKINKDRQVNHSKQLQPVFTEQTLQNVGQTNQIAADKSDVAIEKVDLPIDEIASEKTRRYSDSSESSLLIDFPLPADIPDKTMKEKEIPNYEMTIDELNEQLNSDDGDMPLVIDESYIPRGAVIRGKPRKRIRNGRQKSRRSLEENENPEIHLKRKPEFKWETEGERKHKRHQDRDETKVEPETDYNNWAEPKFEPTNGESIGEMDHNHNVTNLDDHTEIKQTKKHGRIRSISVGSGLRLPIIKPKVRHRRTHSIPKNISKPPDRMNSFDFISPIVERVWADMSKQKTDKVSPNDEVSEMKPSLLDSLSDVDSSESSKTEKEDNKQKLHEAQNINLEEAQRDDDKYNGTLSPGALGTRPLLRTPPTSIPPLITTSGCHVNSEQITSSPESSSPPPLVPSKNSNRRQKPGHINCHLDEEPPYYTVVAKSDTVLKVSRSPTYPKMPPTYPKMPPLVQDLTKTASPILIEDGESAPLSNTTRTSASSPVVIDEQDNDNDSILIEETDKFVEETMDKLRTGSVHDLQGERSRSVSGYSSASGANMDSADDMMSASDYNLYSKSPQEGKDKKSSSPNVVYLHLNSSDLTNAKTKLLVEELDMLITRRELELQSLYSRRARALKKLKHQPHKAKPVAKLKTVEVSSANAIEKPKAIKSKGGAGNIVPPPAHSNQELRRHPKLQPSGVAQRMSNIRVVKWPRTEKNSSKIINNVSKAQSQSKLDNVNVSKTGQHKDVGPVKNYTGQTAIIAGKTVPVLNPTLASSVIKEKPSSIPKAAAVQSGTQTVPSLRTPVPSLTSPLDVTKTATQTLNQPLPPDFSLVNGNHNENKPKEPLNQTKNQTHSAALKEYFVQTHLKEAVRHISSAEQTFATMGPPDNSAQPEQGTPPELYALLSRTRQESNDQAKLQTTQANLHSVTIEKVLNKLQFNKEMTSSESSFQQEPPLAVLSSISQKTIPTSFVHETSRMLANPVLVNQENPTYVLAKDFPEGLVPVGPEGVIRPDGSFVSFICPQNGPMSQVRLPVGPPARFPRPQAGTMHHLGPQFIRTMPPGILQRRPAPVSQHRPIIQVPAPQTSLLPPSASNGMKPTNQTTGQGKVSTSNLPPTELVKKLNEQVNRMQQQLIQSQQGPTSAAPVQQQQARQGAANGGMRGVSVCSSCSNRALFLCAACQKIWYCSKDCQVKSWPSHQIHCTPGH